MKRIKYFCLIFLSLILNFQLIFANDSCEIKNIPIYDAIRDFTFSPVNNDYVHISRFGGGPGSGHIESIVYINGNKKYHTLGSIMELKYSYDGKSLYYTSCYQNQNCILYKDGKEIENLKLTRSSKLFLSPKEDSYFIVTGNQVIKNGILVADHSSTNTIISDFTILENGKDFTYYIKNIKDGGGIIYFGKNGNIIESYRIDGIKTSTEYKFRDYEHKVEWYKVSLGSYAYINNKEELYKDGKKIDNYVKEFQYSSNSKSFAFISTSYFSVDKKLLSESKVVKDGKEIGNKYYDIRNIQYSPDSKEIVYEVFSLKNKNECFKKGICDYYIFIVKNGEEISQKYEESYNPVFSSDSKSLSYIAKKDGKYIVVKDGIEGNKYDAIGELNYVNNTKKIYFIGYKDKKYYLVYDGREFKTDYDYSQDLLFSIFPEIIIKYSKNGEEFAFSNRVENDYVTTIVNCSGIKRFEDVEEKKEEDKTTPAHCFNVDGDTITKYYSKEKGCGKDVIIPSIINGIKITKIGYEAFWGQNLESVVIPEGIKSILHDAFKLNNLTNIIIPKSVNDIGGRAFNHNNFSDNNAFIYARNNDGSEDKTTIVSYAGARKDNIVIPENVTTIGGGAFEELFINSVILPKNLKKIGDSAFYSNYLTNIVIPEGVIEIGNSAFTWNYLTKITIPESVLNIGIKAFAFNDNLNTITINNNSTKIGDNALKNKFYEINDSELVQNPLGTWIVVENEGNYKWENSKNISLEKKAIDMQIPNTLSKNVEKIIISPEDNIILYKPEFNKKTDDKIDVLTNFISKKSNNKEIQIKKEIFNEYSRFLFALKLHQEKDKRGKGFAVESVKNIDGLLKRK